MRINGALTIVAVIGTMAMAHDGEAEPCAMDEKGTYLSNVCWLVEDLSGGFNRVISADKDKCAVTVESALGIRRSNGVFDYERKTIYFDRANLTESDIIRKHTGYCLELVGQDIAEHIHHVKGHVEGTERFVRLCGDKSLERIRNAVTSLYTKYCEGRKSEF